MTGIKDAPGLKPGDKKFVTVINFRVYDVDCSMTIIDDEPLMKHQREALIKDINPTAMESGFVTFEAVVANAGHTPIGVAPSGPIAAERARIREQAALMRKDMKANEANPPA